ncbi:AAA family ATPase [Azospirillum thermophilum]|uniref:AAA family ATPase n=1 Tax=Azospirillum thermophilum TaxID=2202148 RepID=UPI001FE69714|nr:AAA family ATPase [Azospirillum thermophilum]
MRILAVRGCNLTSLDGTFAVEFDQEPLRRAGLFAITGPTGAGKSTILDALCLALFDRMPRLPEGRGVLLGPEGDPNAINSTDVRAVLRRGAGQGWAEVDFVGIDGESYRARWEVRRARQKARGALQPQTVALGSLDGSRRFGDGKKSVLEEIEKRLGLSFEQFRRSVLLAQGDFATFLKAPPKDRSALLELLTGTEIYSRLSITAHERAGQEKQELAALEAQCAGVPVMEGEERAALEAEAAALADSVQAAETAVETARAVTSWHERDRQLSASEAAARDSAARAEETWKAAAPRRDIVALLRRLQPLRRLLADADRTAAEAAQARDAVARADLALADARKAVETATAHHAGTRRDYEAACLAQQEAEPQLVRAADLDGKIAALEDQQRAAEAERSSARRRLAEAAAALEQAKRTLDEARAEVAEREAWLAARGPLAPVVEQWSRWEAAMSRHAAASRTLAEAQREVRRQAETSATLMGERESLAGHHARATEALAAAEAALAALQAESVPPLEDTGQRRKSLAQRRDRLTTLAVLADTLDRLARERAEAEAEQARCLEEAEAQDGLARAAGEAQRLCEAALAEAEATLHRLRLARREDVGSLRAQLVEGEPCPVCGAAEHPWAAGGDSPLARLAHEQEDRVAALKADLARHSRAHGAHEAAGRAAREGAAKAAGRRADCAREQADRLAVWTAAHSGLALPAEPDGTAVRTALAAVEADLTEVAAAEALAIDHRGRLDAAQGQRRRCEAARAEAAAAMDALDRKLADARHAGEIAGARRDRADQDRTEALEELALPFAALEGWRAELARDPQVFSTTLAGKVTAFQTQRAALAQAAGRTAEAETALAARAAAHESAQTAATAAGERVDGLAGLVGDARRERAGLLDGRPVAEVRAGLDARRTRAHALVDHATIARQDAAARLSAAEQEVATRREAAHACAGKAAEAAERLEDGAKACAVGVEEARRHLSHDEGWLEREEAALADFETARRDASLLLAERERQRREHHAAGVPALTAEEAQAALAEAGERLRALRDRLAELRGRLNADRQNRDRLASIMGAVEAQRERYRLWASLNELIGSANGQKMRNFAQSLSLDALLVQANRYLEDLARRYRLERVAGADLEIQVVDREMADERRGVHSLSGGELFLVSLALALGLSAMAAGTAGGIGTLFIDEGFGTLDPTASTSRSPAWRPCRRAADRSASSAMCRRWSTGSACRSGWSRWAAAAASCGCAGRPAPRWFRRR